MEAAVSRPRVLLLSRFLAKGPRPRSSCVSVRCFHRPEGRASCPQSNKPSAQQLEGISRLVCCGSSSAPLFRRPYPCTFTAQSNSRFSSSKTGVDPKNAARDTRLAGRRRFYKSVGITATSPPWEHLDDIEEDSEYAMVDSPISAGVDDTQSGSGITIERPSRKAMLQILTPQPPGVGGGSSSSEAAWHGVTLDGRPIRTPIGQPLSVPSASLALAIAAEWDAQVDTIHPAQMPLMTMACTALDQTASMPEVAIQHSLRFLQNDTTCYLADPTEDRVLHRKQMTCWDRLHEWASHESNLGSSPAVAVGAGEGLLMSRARRDRDKPSGLPHPDELMMNADAWVRTLDAWHLTALQGVCSEAKSFLVGMAVVSGMKLVDEDTKSGEHRLSTPRSPFADDTAKAVAAARVEEEFNIENWGLVEGGHDYDRLNCSVSMHAANFLISAIAIENHLEDDLDVVSP